MTQDYYNTTGLTGGDLAACKTVAQMQQRVIYEYVKANPTMEFTREDLRPLFPAKTPVTSIVRALCNLRDLGVISVVGKTMGLCNRPIFVYRYVQKQAIQQEITTSGFIPVKND